jgi:ribosome-associated toxin RatA of RatAB toxin-antitoxin module
MSFITDFESYQNFFPKQIKEVKILERQNNEIITEETIIFSTLIKRSFVQKSRHKIISDKELFTEILEGPAKGSIVKIICSENDQGSQIEFDAELKLSLKAKFLSPLIKKLYKQYLTAIIFKITERAHKQQNSN